MASDPLSNENRQMLRQAALMARFESERFPGDCQHSERFAIAWTPEVCLLILTELERRLDREGAV